MTLHPTVSASTKSASTKRGDQALGDLVGIGPTEPEFCRHALLAENPLAWLIEIDGLIVDTMPP